MGFIAYSSPLQALTDDIMIDGSTPPTLTEKDYFILDKIDINYVGVNDAENINVDVKLNIYNSYEERLLRGDILMTQKFTIQGLIDKNFSENLWTTCYLKIKELILNQNIQYLKEALRLSDSDTIPSQYQYLLEIDDHFN